MNRSVERIFAPIVAVVVMLCLAWFLLQDPNVRRFAVVRLCDAGLPNLSLPARLRPVLSPHPAGSWDSFDPTCLYFDPPADMAGLVSFGEVQHSRFIEPLREAGTDRYVYLYSNGGPPVREYQLVSRDVPYDQTDRWSSPSLKAFARTCVGMQRGEIAPRDPNDPWFLARLHGRLSRPTTGPAANHSVLLVERWIDIRDYCEVPSSGGSILVPGPALTLR